MFDHHHTRDTRVSRLAVFSRNHHCGRSSKNSMTAAALSATAAASLAAAAAADASKIVHYFRESPQLTRPAPALPAWKKNGMRGGLLHWRAYCMKLQRAHRANFFARARGRRRVATLSLLRWWTRTSLAVLLMVTASLHWASTRAKCSMTAWKKWAAGERRRSGTHSS